ncbi:2777_t:CDS:1 [Paraglomus occultum]|uniref:2777_t:CDS:1 n=1 Tax=Paraglomus occultum TaxID=144539 RepID=A0A9N9FZG7_9GLOM|nr:2777_t:CDS:1 [Paraglomus occultum]
MSQSSSDDVFAPSKRFRLYTKLKKKRSRTGASRKSANQTNALQPIDNDMKCKRPPSRTTSRTTSSENDPTKPSKSTRALKKSSSYLDLEKSIHLIPKLLPSHEPVSQSFSLSISSSEEEFQPPKSRISMRNIESTNAGNLKKQTEIIPAPDAHRLAMERGQIVLEQTAKSFNTSVYNAPATPQFRQSKLTQKSKKGIDMWQLQSVGGCNSERDDFNVWTISANLICSPLMANDVCDCSLSMQ